MKKLTGTFTEQSLKALIEFLKRTTLKGNEVPIFNNLQKELQNFKPVTESDLTS